MSTMTLGAALAPGPNKPIKLRDKTLTSFWSGKSNASRRFTSFSASGDTACKEASPYFFPS